MRTFLCILGAMVASSSLPAQTSTNQYIPNGADMRIVEGKMYNRVLSTNWLTLPAPGSSLEVVAVVADGLVLQVHQGDTAAAKLLVKHYPGDRKLAKGKVLTKPFRAMSVADLKYGAETVAAYDCGLPNTKENRKTLVNGPIHSGDQK